jgi:type IV pilus assembly protein PilM
VSLKADMNVIATPVTASHLTHCGNCGHLNHEDSKFCGGCGQSVFEPCGSCQTSVRLTQKFCGECGADLEAMLQNRLQSAEQALVLSLNEVKNYEYAPAIARLTRLARDRDYRFAVVTEQAQKALPKVVELRDQKLKRFSELETAGLEAAGKNDNSRVVELLSAVPPAFLGEDAKGALRKAKSFLSEVTDLQNSLKEALSAEDWCLAGSLLSRALTIFPEEACFQQLSENVAKRLAAEADALFEKLDYEAALSRLDSIPSAFQAKDHEEKKDRIANIQWLAGQFQPEPFATPTLGRLAVRLGKESPSDPQAKEMVKKIAAALKESKREPASPYPPWLGRRQSSAGGDVSILGWPQTIEFSSQEVISKNPARFGVAFGLAMQSLQVGSFESGFVQKKSLMSSLAFKRTPPQGVGIDIGTSSIKAVQLRKDGDKLVVANSYLREFQATTRAGSDGKSLMAMREAIKEMLASAEWTGVESWVNYPTREILARFIELPPVEDKKAGKLLDLEAKDQFPVNLDELEVIRWIADGSKELGVGRPSMLLAARKLNVTQRWDLLTEVGLKPVGLQCEAVALMNLIKREHKELLEQTDTPGAIPALVVVDAGATSTTFLLLASNRLWFRTIDGGGEEMTAALARSGKLVRDEAERLKKLPHELSSPASQYQPIVEKQDAINHRMKQILTEAQRNIRGLNVTKTIVTGGACLGYGWIQRVICKQ